MCRLTGSCRCRGTFIIVDSRIRFHYGWEQGGYVLVIGRTQSRTVRCIIQKGHCSLPRLLDVWPTEQRQSRCGGGAILMRVLIPIFLMFYLSACVKQLGPAATQDISNTAPDASALEISALQESVEKHQQTERELRNEIADLQIQLLEKEAIITGLRRDSQEQQKRLDDAIVEVVRTKAKLQSLESKADAASTIAETEIALKTLKNLIPEEQDNTAEITKAESLLEMSSEEFKLQNFGGALYLAGQARTQISMGQLVLSGTKNVTVMEGEVLFLHPLPLVVTKKSNLRSGPDINQKILTQLEKGTSVVGYSYKGQWVRIETEAKKSGWIFQTLVRAP